MAKKSDFEKNMDRLKEISNEMESGFVNLEDSLKKYEEGVVLYKKCMTTLKNAEKRITIIVEDQEKAFDLSED